MSRREKALRRAPSRVPAPPPTPAFRPPPLVLSVAIALAAMACVLYASSWRYGFVGDDSLVISKNAWTQQGLSALGDVVSHSLYFGAVPLNGGLYRPLAGAYFVVVGALVGLKPSGYHFAQILLYGLNVATVFLFFTRIARRGLAVPVVATLVFLVHPIHTEVVNNIKSADELLCLEFFLIGSIAWLGYADDGRTRWKWLAVGAYALAVASKETAVPMVIVLPALWYFCRGRDLKGSLTAAWPFLAVALVFVGLRQLVLSSEPPTNIVTVLNNALVVSSDRSVQLASALNYLALYVRMLFWPHPLSFDYTYNAIPLRSFRDPATWFAIAILAGLGAALVAGFRKRRIEAFAILWCGAALVAVSNVFFLVSTNFGERLLYLPSVAFAYAVAHYLFKATRVDDTAPLPSLVRTPAIVAPVALVVALSGVTDLRRTRDWRDEVTLFGTDVKTYPNSARLNNYFGNLLYFQGEELLGQPDFAELSATDFANAKKYLLKGLGILDRFQNLHVALGMAEYHLKEYREAVPHLERSLAFDDFREPAAAMLADAFEQLGEPGGALALYRKLDADGVDYPPGWFELGNDATAHGDDEGAIRYFSKFVAARPDNVAGRFNLASAFYRKGFYKQAMAAADECVGLDPLPAVAAKCLLLGADVLARTGHADQAMARYEQAKALDPNSPWIRK